MNPEILKAIAVTAELTSTELSAAALRVLAADLAAYPEAAVMRALDRCRKELTGRLTPAAIFERIDDGRPTADEAWAIAMMATDEAETVVWTGEIAQAWEIAKPIFEGRDKVGARMAFRDAYDRLCRAARATKSAAKWSVSIGWDAGRRDTALVAAVTAGYLPAPEAQKLLSGPQDVGAVGRLLLGAPANPGDEISPEVAERCRALLAGLNESASRMEEARQSKIQREREDFERRRQAAIDATKAQS